MRIGVLGVGHLASVIVTRLVEGGWPADRLVLSPRGKGPEIAARHGLELAAHNAALVAGAETILLAVRPVAAEEALRGLPWKQHHIIVSACAGVSIARLTAAAGEAPRIMRVMPLTAAALGASPTTAFPDLPEARSLLEQLGPVLPMPSEEAFETATVTAAVYGWAQDLVRQTSGWLAAHGVENQVARRLSALTLVAAGRVTAESHTDLADLMRGLVTPGGITELGLKTLEEKGASAAWEAACDAVFARLQGKTKG